MNFGVGYDCLGRWYWYRMSFLVSVIRVAPAQRMGLNEFDDHLPPSHKATEDRAVIAFFMGGF